MVCLWSLIENHTEYVDRINGLILWQSPRPPPLARSTTEPTTRQKAAKKAMFPNLPASAGLPPPVAESPAMDPPSNKRKTPMNELSETESRSSSHQSKRPKYSTEPSETYPAAQRSESTPTLILKTPKTPLPVIKTPELIFTTEDIAKARTYANELSSMYETEKNVLKEGTCSKSFFLPSRDLNSRISTSMTFAWNRFCSSKLTRDWER